MSASDYLQEAFEAARDDFLAELKGSEPYDFSEYLTIDAVYDETERIQEEQGKIGTLRNLKRIEPDILDLYATTLKFFRKSKWNTYFESLWPKTLGKLNVIKNNIIAHKSLMNEEVTFESVIRAEEDRRRANDVHERAQEHQDWQSFEVARAGLNPHFYDGDLERLAKESPPEAGQWLEEDDSFEKWSNLDNDTTRIFWLQGIPGAGKTITTSLAICRKKEQGYNVLFAILSHNWQARDSALKILHSLIFQALLINLELRTLLIEMYKFNFAQLSSSTRFAAALLSDLVKNSGPIFIILDGVDEISPVERHNLLKVLISMVGDCENLRLLISSREESDISSVIGERVPCIRVDRSNSRDIELYVKNEIQQWHKDLSRYGLDDDECSEMADLLKPISSMAKGMFLFAKLVIRNVKAQSNPVDMMNEIHNFPDGIDEAYGRIISRIKNQLPPNQQDIAGHALKWIGCATYPLRQEETLQALAIKPGERNFAKGRKILADIFELCGPIIEIESGVVQFVHFTAKEYLLSTRNDALFDKASAHLLISSICLSYLSFECLDEEIYSRDFASNILAGEYILLEYASTEWLWHVRNCSSVLPTESLQVLQSYITNFMLARGKSISQEPSNKAAAIEDWKFLTKRGLLENDERNDWVDYDPSTIFTTVRRVRQQIETMICPSQRHKLGCKCTRLQNLYGNGLFKCDRLGCPYFKSGFDSLSSRDDHLKAHNRSFKCPEKGCDFAEFGFSSSSDLEQHRKRAHWIQPVFRSKVVDLSLNLAPQDPVAILEDAVRNDEIANIAEFLGQISKEHIQKLLEAAAEEASPAMLNLLLGQAVRVYSLSLKSSGSYLLWRAIHGRNVAMVNHLLRLGTDPNDIPLDWRALVNNRPSRAAFQFGHAEIDIIESLLSFGLEIDNETNSWSWLPTKLNGVDEVEILDRLTRLAKYLPSKEAMNSGLNQVAIYSKSIPQANFFLEMGANMDSIGSQGVTPLYLVIRFNEKTAPEFARWLLQRGADPYPENTKGYKITQLASMKRFEKRLWESFDGNTDSDDQLVDTLHQSKRPCTGSQSNEQFQALLTGYPTHPSLESPTPRAYKSTLTYSTLPPQPPQNVPCAARQPPPIQIQLQDRPISFAAFANTAGDGINIYRLSPEVQVENPNLDGAFSGPPQGDGNAHHLSNIYIPQQNNIEANFEQQTPYKSDESDLWRQGFDSLGPPSLSSIDNMSSGVSGSRVDTMELIPQEKNECQASRIPQQTLCENSVPSELSSGIPECITSSPLAPLSYTSHLSTPASERRLESVELELEYDTCFGMIRTSPIKRWRDPAEQSSNDDGEISLQIQGDLVAVYDDGSKAYRGSIDHHTGRILAALSHNFSITFVASLECKKSGRRNATSAVHPSLLVAIHGFQCDGDDIGKFLSDGGLNLQHPVVFDRSVPYNNPQYLLRPGSHLQLPMCEASNFRPKKASTDRSLKPQLSLLPPYYRVEIVPEESGSYDDGKRIRKTYQSGVPISLSIEGNTIIDLAYLRYWNSVTRLSQLHPPPICLGGLLADDMSLGKTLTALTLIASCADKTQHMSVPAPPSGVKARHATFGSLIVTPLSILTCWEEQIKRHFKSNSIRYVIYHGAEREQNIAEILANDIVITTYNTLRAECPYSSTKSKSQSKRAGLLHSIYWWRVILDEAHTIRNQLSQVFCSAHALDARHRWCLTGTPIQNRLEDFGALLEFLRVHPFDSPQKFHSHFIKGLGGISRSTMEKLKTLVNAVSLRRTKEIVVEELKLGPRIEEVRKVELNEDERRIYNIVKRSWDFTGTNSGSARGVFNTILKLRQICNHGRDLLSSETLKLLDEGFITETLSKEISGEIPTCENCGELQASSSTTVEDYILPCMHFICRSCCTSIEDKGDGEGTTCPLCSGNATRAEDNSVRQVSEDRVDTCARYIPSSKVLSLLQNLDADRTTYLEDPVKSVVFSSWTGMLDLIEKALVSYGFSFERIDGSKSLSHRKRAIQSFRSNPSCTILLASIGSAGVGLDLTAASHVHLMEPQWNPMAEEQALDRCHRLGQTREVKAIRYVVKDSIEEYVQKTQKTKLDLINASFGDSSSSKTAKMEDLLKSLRAALE
ncbi:hypothetical protein B7463_g3424, partial [Scytalidium lignicola]